MSTDDRSGGFVARWSRRKALARHGALPPEAKPEPAPLPGRPAALPSGMADASAVADLADAATIAQTSGAADAAAVGPAADPRAAPAAPLPTLADVAELTRDADFTRFVAPGVDGEVRNAALRKLFTDPRFNVMDGLDTYIDDYGKPDPLPASMLRQMVQSTTLGLFSGDNDAATTAAAVDAKPAPTPEPAPEPTPTAPGAVTRAAPRSHLLEVDTVPDEDPDLQLQPDAAAGPEGAEPGARGDPRGQC